jgi:hypothetical protein
LFEFESGSLSDIGGATNMRDQQWAKVTINLKDTENGHISSAEIRLLVPKRPDATLLELEQSARSMAISILKEALSLAEQSSIAEWTEKEWAKAAADRQVLAAWDSPDIG